MRAVLQRVNKASVHVDAKEVSSIDKGLLILLGIENEDREEDINWLSAKISKMRIFSDENDLMNLSVKDVKGDILVVSQFTLYASIKKGNRPSFIRSAPPEIAIPLYESFVSKLESELGRKVFTGVFGAMMDISLVNDGPVTIVVDSKNII